MPIVDLYEHSDQRHNLAHFATLASLAAVDGEINEKEKAVLDKFAFKLNITGAEYKEVMKKENKYPIQTPHSGEKRLKAIVRIVSDGICRLFYRGGPNEPYTAVCHRSGVFPYCSQGTY